MSFRMANCTRTANILPRNGSRSSMGLGSLNSGGLLLVVIALCREP